MVFVLQAQEQKLRVAVFDPTTSGIAMDEGTKLAVQELISSAFVNTGRFIIVERSMIDKIMKEQAFQNSDMADNSQATEVGKLAGANKIVLSAVSLVGGRNMLSVKIIDVQTATVDQQKTKIVSSNDLLDAVEPLTLELLDEKVVYTKQETQFISQQKKEENREESKKDDNKKGEEITLILSEVKGRFLDISNAYNMQIFFENKEILNQRSGRFSVKFNDANLGVHSIRIVCTSIDVPNIIKEFSFLINTVEKKIFEFIGDVSRGNIAINMINKFNPDCYYECVPCNLKVACSDMPNKLTWDEAMNAPQGWRLPTVKELQCLAKYKNQIPDLKKNSYWSSEENKKKAYVVTLNDKERETEDKDDEDNVRYVK
ncbi:DUF1566 domain-containing protein [Bacteroidales bacterium OttesenSCG-928-I21]|nr:DUF1566 domain-containing protein [Bacteroidales bacterium OttesenSCG-928-I21]